MSDAIQVVRELWDADKKPWLALSDAQANALERVLAVAEAAVALHNHQQKTAYTTETWHDLANDERGLQADYDAAVAALTTTTEGESHGEA